MNLLLLFGIAVGCLFVGAVMAIWRASRRGSGEERAHASAWRRRRVYASVAGQRPEASLMILGDLESRAKCQVKRVTKSAVWAQSVYPIGQGAQVRIDWGHDVFIGNIKTEKLEPAGYTLEIALLSSTYRAGILTALTNRFCS